MIYIEMNEIGLIAWTIVITFPSFIIAMVFIAQTIKDIKDWIKSKRIAKAEKKGDKND